MSLPQPDPDRFNLNLLVHMWAAVNGVRVDHYDDLWVEDDTFSVGDPFMDAEYWESFRSWQAERGLQSSDEIKRCLEEYGFLPKYDTLTEDVPSHRHFLCLSDDPTKKHAREITEDEIRAMDLVPCGGFDVGEISETYWVPRGHPSGDNNYSRDDNIPF